MQCLLVRRSTPAIASVNPRRRWIWRVKCGDLEARGNRSVRLVACSREMKPAGKRVKARRGCDRQGAHEEKLEIT